MSCSCQQNSCSCDSKPVQTTCPPKPCKPKSTCECSREVLINPLTVTPVSSCDPADNKYSVETEVKPSGGSGSQKSTYAGQAIGTSAAARVAAIHTSLTDIAIDLIRGVIGEAYTGPFVPSTGFDGTLQYSDVVAAAGSDTAILSSVNAFINYFLNSQPSAAVQALPEYMAGTFTEVTDAEQSAKVQYIATALYQVYQSIQRHIEGATSVFSVCPAGGSRVIKIEIENCLFCLTLIYN